MSNPKDTTISYGLVGCGMIGAAHLNGMKLLREAGIHCFSLRAVCDTDRDRAEKFSASAAQFQTTRPQVYIDYQKMLKKETLDAIDLCTVHDSHHSIGMDILKAGIHLLVEKPLALTIRAGHALIKAATESGKVLATAENYRRQPYFRMMKRTLEEGLVGSIDTVILLDSSFGNQIIVDSEWRHLKKRCGAGMLTDRGIHHADLFEHLLGAIEEVYGVVSVLSPERYTFDSKGKLLRSQKCDAEDTCSGIMKFQSGATGLWHITAAGHGEWFDELEWCFLGGKGSMRGGRVVLDDGRQFSKDQMTHSFMQGLELEEKDKWFPGGVTDAFAIEQYDFFQSVLNGRPPEVDASRGLRAMAVCYAFCESSLIGKPVKVADVESGKMGQFQSDIDSFLDV